MNDQNWMFQKSKLDPAYSGLDRGYNSKTGALAPLAMNGPVNAVSRASNGNGSKFIASPSGTDWARTFGRNGGLGASGQRSAVTSQPQSFSKPFTFDLSPSTDRSQLSWSQNEKEVTSPVSNYFRDRVSKMDLTKQDHELYGAGSEYGFGY